MARRHLLIGGGPGAIAAAETIREADEGAEIVVVGADHHGYYSRPGLAYLLAKEVPEKRLSPLARHDLARLNVTSLRETVAGIDPAEHWVTLEGGRRLSYDRLLIATGSTAIATRVPGAELDGVVKLDDLDDARDIIRRSAGAKRAVVVGGGITALEIVEGLLAHHVRVDYLMRQDRYWKNVLSESESQLVEEELRRGGVRVHHFTDLARILGRGGRVAAVETGEGERIPCDLVAVAIGVRPRVELAKAAGLACERGILVDEYLRASAGDVFAAGDVAETADAAGRRTLEVLWDAAVVKGRVAGLNMATEPVHVYKKGVPLNITRLAGLKTTIIGTVGNGKDADLEGISRGDSQTWSELGGEAVLVETRSADARLRLELGERVIVGAVVMGDQALSFALQELIEARADLGGVAAELQAPGAPVAELVDGFWREWAAARA